MKLHALLSAGVASIALAACGNGYNDTATIDDEANIDMAQTDTSADMQAQMRVTQEFIDAAGQATLAEIRTSEVGVSRATATNVRDFAQMLLEDHTQSAQAMMTAISGSGVMPPASTLGVDAQARLDDITVEEQGSSGESGAEWDHDFIAMQIDMHEDAIVLFERYANDSTALPAVRQYAQSTLPKLEAHLVQAKQIQDSMSDGNLLTPQ